MNQEVETIPRFRHPAIIFDRDGTLIASEPVLMEARRETVKKFLGADLSLEMNQASFGKSAEAMCEMYIQEYGGDPSLLERMVLYFRATYNEIYETDGIQPIVGGVELIKDLKKEGLRLAIGTGGNKLKAARFLEMAGYDMGDFEVITSRGDVHQDKPNPEIFLRTAGALKLAPFQCVVVGDAKNDLTAARLSGMPTIHYNPDGITNFSHNMAIVTNLSQITNEKIQSL